MNELALKNALDANRGQAEEIVKDVDKTERLLERAEQKLKLIPGVGDTLADVPILISLVRAYVKKEYTDIPIGSILGIVAALLYLLNQFDLIPDFIPGVGYLDDVGILIGAIAMAHDDVEEYRQWKMDNAK